jgi:hypothetical protein
MIKLSAVMPNVEIEFWSSSLTYLYILKISGTSMASRPKIGF